MALHKGQLETVRQLMARQKDEDARKPVPWTKTDLDTAAQVADDFLQTSIGTLIASLNQAGAHQFSVADARTLLGIVAAVKENAVSSRPEPPKKPGGANPRG